MGNTSSSSSSKLSPTELDAEISRAKFTAKLLVAFCTNGDIECKTLGWELISLKGTLDDMEKEKDEKNISSTIKEYQLQDLRKNVDSASLKMLIFCAKSLGMK